MNTYRITLTGTIVMAGMLSGGVSRTSAEEEERPAVPGGMYDKHYIQRGGRGTILGGYMDHEPIWNDDRKTFDQHRFIPCVNFR